jgi:hypothetical protein
MRREICRHSEDGLQGKVNSAVLGSSRFGWTPSDKERSFRTGIIATAARDPVRS